VGNEEIKESIVKGVFKIIWRVLWESIKVVAIIIKATAKAITRFIIFSSATPVYVINKSENKPLHKYLNSSGTKGDISRERY
jgi:hypothetical protein